MKMKLKCLLTLLTLFGIVVNASRIEELRRKLPQGIYDDDYDDDEDDKSVPSLSIDNEAIADRVLGVNGSTPRFSCFSCEPPSCSHPTVCHNALRCYTAHTRDTDGLESKSKGKKVLCRPIVEMPGVGYHYFGGN